MRLSKEQEIRASNELLAMLASNRRGLRTSEMCGTPAFHGARTLSLRQVARLLRKSGKTVAILSGSPWFSYHVWKLSDEAWDEARKGRSELLVA